MSLLDESCFEPINELLVSVSRASLEVDEVSLASSDCLMASKKELSRKYRSGSFYFLSETDLLIY